MSSSTAIEAAGAEAEVQQQRAGGRVDLTPFINPIIPGAVEGPPPVDVEGWSQLDTWDTWRCAAT